MDKNYWENYYKTVPINQKPSLFALFVQSNYLKAGQSLLEFGCGNGRDSVFFAQNDINVLAIDQCEREIEYLEKTLNNKNIKYISTDFTNLEDMGTFDIIYSRFTLHSITEEQENRVIKWSSSSLKTGGYLCIEARGLKNELYKMGEKIPGEKNAYQYDNHYRRFIDISILARKMKKHGLTVVLQKEERGFAPYNDTDYTFIRLIAKK